MRPERSDVRRPLRTSHLAYALDFPDLESARAGATLVAPHAGVLKVGLELFVQAGPAAVHMAQGLGCDVFLDLKLHDIEKTVERAVGTASQLGVKFLTLHASGGPQMLRAAAERAQKENAGLVLLGVTVLTSLDASDLNAVGVDATPAEQVLRLAHLARDCGLGGLVCSSHEVAALRQSLGSSLCLVTPGIRPAGSAAGDQKRVGTPAEAIAQGADVLVVGRPIRDAQDPAGAARGIALEIQESLTLRGERARS